MGESEFDIIEQYFKASKRTPRKDVILSVGDDCAITEHQRNQRIAITTDTMVENIHFLPTVHPADLAYKLVATNLSDLAAMGAEPAWFSLALTLPKIEHQWLEQFSLSFFETLDYYNIDLIGGDTTRGNCHVLTLTAQGILAKGKALCRHSAKVGDWIYVSGYLGDSAAGLSLLLERYKTNNSACLTADSFTSNIEKYLVQRHLRPTPRVLFGLELADSVLANAAIDISDGLLADLGHILKRSHCSAVIDLDTLPISTELLTTVGRAQAENLALTGGEDYELCFSVADNNRQKLERNLNRIGVPYTCIGKLCEAHPQPRIFFHRSGKPVAMQFEQGGFDHFK